MRPPSRLLLLLGLAGACQREGVAFTSSTSTSTSTTAPASTDTSDATASTSTGTGSADATTNGPTTSSTSDGSTSSTSSTSLVHDVGSTKDLDDGTPPGCKGKIDFLFVISRAGPMQEIQAQLVDAFPKFIATIESKFEDFDYHIMVIPADSKWGHANCTDDCPALDCKRVDPCCPYSQLGEELCCPIPDYPCAFLDLVDACDSTMGAGSVFPAGLYASNTPCPIDGGRRYMIKGQKDLAETFACAAQIGVAGGNKIGDALTAAMTYTINNPGGCNEGFLRKDALLMVTLVNPGSDTKSQGGPEHWYKAVVAAKSFDPSSVVMLNIGNIQCFDEDMTCQLTKMFPYHLVGDNEAPDLSTNFDKAVILVESACTAFIPQ